MSFSRRNLLRRTAGVAGGLLFADVLGLDRLTAAARSPIAAASDDEDPNFLQAQIQSIQGTTIAALTPEFSTRLVRVSSGTEIWRTFPVSLGDLRPGDFFYARGDLDDEGYLNAKWLWANIVNVTGSLTLGGDHRSGDLALPDRRIYHVHMAPNVTLFGGQGPLSSVADLGVVAEKPAQIIGMWDEASGTIEVTSLWT